MAFQSIPLGLYPPGRNFDQQEQKPPINNNQNVPVPPPQPPPPPINGEKSAINTLICDQCGKTFADKNSFHQHAQFHSKPFACKMAILHQHVRIHTGEKPYGCERCGEKFSQKAILVQHIRVHTGEKPFPCMYCDKKFSQKAILLQHIRVHTGEKPYGCEHCGKRFRQKTILQQHIRIHTGEKPFVCELCDEKFSQKGNLQKHLRSHSGEKPFVCDHCGLKFTRKVMLDLHIRMSMKGPHTSTDIGKPVSCHFGLSTDNKQLSKPYIFNAPPSDKPIAKPCHFNLATEKQAAHASLAACVSSAIAQNEWAFPQ
ncbi:hypothetical protein TNIN_276571 [Trichonephila inaurata madagascariensis]|uniref:C2H2-type domain-containing protein n=1 Tax=Trichonephila inaurata madagascariensis TaxID=2747483 RepID=A0A8X7C948_9ARAC|nr:hypothetical protein TNIN_276571 [Trichonephila inaurata madagascariensis]